MCTQGCIFFCIPVWVCLLQEHIHLLSCRPWELRTGTAESLLQTFPRSECRPPAAALTCFSTVQMLHCSDRLAVHHPDARLWSSLFVSRAVTGEILQISKGRWITESNMTWGRGREEGREYAVIISLSLQYVSGMVLGASVWLMPMTTGRGLRDCSWNSSDCQGPAAQPMGYIWISQL